MRTLMSDIVQLERELRTARIEVEVAIEIGTRIARSASPLVSSADKEASIRKSIKEITERRMKEKLNENPESSV